MNTDTKQFFIYARKSTDDADRQIRSIEDQLAEVRELASRHNLKVVDELVEKQSAKKPGRPVFNEMIARIEKGEASGILAWHPDRLARNMLDGGRIIHMVDTGTIKDMKFPTIDFQPTSQGKLTLAMLFGMSKYYVDALSENIKRGQKHKLKNGIWPMMAPVGYLNDHKARIIKPDPVRAPFIRKAFELHATGEYTLDRLKEVVDTLGMTNRSGKLLSRAQYHRMLQNPLYCGIIRYSGESYTAKHEPIVSKALFDAVQEMIGRKSKPKTPTLKPYLYRGMFRCGECGCFVTTETQKGHNYVHCTKRVKKDCSQAFLREDRMHDFVMTALIKLALTPEWADWMIAELENDKAQAQQTHDEQLKAFQDDLQRLDAKLDRLLTAYVEGDVAADEYRKAKGKLISEKQDLTGRLTALEQNRVKRFEPAIRFVNEAKQAGILASGTDAIANRDFLRKNGSNLTLFNRELKWEPREAWQLIAGYGPFAQHDTSAPASGARVVGEIDQICKKRRR
jgi:site-specific DNA recombinase